MKIKNILVPFVVMASFSVAVTQQQQVERTVLYPVQLSDSMIEIAPGQSFSREIQFEKKEYPVHRKLRVVGGVKMPGKFAPRGEEFFRQSEYLLNDNLDSLTRKKERYSLYFKGGNEAFERYAYYRVTKDMLPKGDVVLEIQAKRNGLKVSDNGEFGVQLELFFAKEGRHPDEIYDRPDSIVFLPIPEGSGNFAVYKQKLRLPSYVVCAVVRLGGTLFSGECWMESPRLSGSKQNGWNAPFALHENRPDNYNYWVGVNLATRSWPLWSLSFAGKTVFQGNIFDRASDIADFYIDIPATVHGNGQLTLTLHSEKHRATFPYQLRSVQLIEESARDFEIVSAPTFLSEGKSGGILVEVNRPGVTVKVDSSDDVEFAQSQYTFSTVGLHVIPVKAIKCASQIPVTITAGGEKRTTVIGQIIRKADDDIYISSGDEVHIDKESAPYDYFFKWYVRERIGNWYQFRPSYQWSGVRITDNKIINHYTQLLNDLQMPYAWQMEGRTLAASRINASDEALATPLFRGRQAHENDGGYYYWRHFKYNGLFSDFAARTRPYGGIFAKHRPLYTDHGVYVHYDPFGVKDMAHGAEIFVKNLAYSRGPSTRHTGPSAMFRYLYKAGYEWLGAEQMYGPEETIMSALRGASLAYDKKSFGSLHAMQWGSAPFTDPKHSLRLYMSLAVAYMHGSSHINTEEALWTDEYANDRFTESGKQHIFAQHQMLDYIETHARQGEMTSHVAVLQGRNDAWKSFIRGPIWSQESEGWEFGKAQESFDLLRVFYPGNILDNAPPEGWFTHTPYGTVDILPIEISSQNLTRYKSVVFLGWNTYDEKDFRKLAHYVKEGGHLLLSGAHFNAELHPAKPIRFPEDDAVLRELLGDNYKQYMGRKEISYGKGTVIYFPAVAYPADDSLRPEYEAELKKLAQQSTRDESKKGWVASNEGIGFSVWDTSAQRAIYMLNTDWQSDKSFCTATLLLGNYSFNIAVPSYHLITATCNQQLAVVPQGNTSSVLSIKENKIGWDVQVQTTKADNFTLCNGVAGTQTICTVQGAGIHTFSVKR